MAHERRPAADRIEWLAKELSRIAFELRGPEHPPERAARLFDEAEWIANEVRSVMRGRR